jgi:GTPase SAR1 family protein
VGKTSFINRITKGVFVTNLSSTLGVDFQVKTICVDERNIALQLWDTAGTYTIYPKVTESFLVRYNKNRSCRDQLRELSKRGPF